MEPDRKIPEEDLGDIWVMDVGRSDSNLSRSAVVRGAWKAWVRAERGRRFRGGVDRKARGGAAGTERLGGRIGSRPNRASFVHADNLHRVPLERLDKYVGTLDPETMREVSKKVILALELETVSDKS